MDADPAAPEGEWRPRAVFAGCAVGLLLAASNLYLALKIGYVDSGHVAAAILGFAVLGARRRSPMSKLDNNLIQTTAVSVAAVPSATGLTAAVPAIQLLGTFPAPWALALWGASISAMGILSASWLRRRLLVDERLPFPTGVATAEVISAMHADSSEGSRRARSLLGAALGAGLFTWFRDGRPRFIPPSTLWSGAVRGTPGSALALGASWNPMLLGVGAIIGPLAGIGLLIGGVVAWIVIAPILASTHRVADPSYRALVGWLVWPGVALLVGAGAVSISHLPSRLRQTLSDLKWRHKDLSKREGRVFIWAGLAALAAMFISGWYAYRITPLYVAFGAALFLLSAGLAARAAGQTDIIPSSQLGQLTQIGYGLLFPGRPEATVPMGSMVSGHATQVGTTLWSLRAGLALGSPPRSQVLGALVGSCVGAFAAVPIYRLLTQMHGLATPQLPIPGGLQWRAVAQLAGSGSQSLPPLAGWAVLGGLALGTSLVLATRTRIGRFVPSPFAIGIGFLLPASYTATLFAGSVLGWTGRRLLKSPAQERVSSWAAGAIVGEAVIGVILALLTGYGWL